MDTELIQYKYKHSKEVLKKENLVPNIIILVSILLIFVFVRPFIVAIGILMVGAVLSNFLKEDKVISISDEFLILDKEIIYFSLVEKATYNHKKKGLRLDVKGQIRPVLIWGKNFPTDARKDWKIKKHQATKLVKVADKILKRVQKKSPNAIIKTAHSPGLEKYEQNTDKA